MAKFRNEYKHHVDLLSAKVLDMSKRLAIVEADPQSDMRTDSRGVISIVAEFREALANVRVRLEIGKLSKSRLDQIETIQLKPTEQTQNQIRFV